MKFNAIDVRKSVGLYSKYFTAAILLMATCLLTSASAAVPELQPEDCAKCHTFQVKMVAAEGGLHATEVGCLDCHQQHPPEGFDTMVACVVCHAGEAHYQVGDCQQCHAVPHKPLASLRDPVKPARKECLSCHAEIGKAMAAAPSMHSEEFCNSCHETHGESPDCLDCHDPHVETQLGPDCLRCHPVHTPLQVTPLGYIPATSCRVCHVEVANALADTNTNHGGINCVSCHQGMHPASPNCQECHGLPHAQTIHSQHRDCLECHGDPHLLISHR